MKYISILAAVVLVVACILCAGCTSTRSYTYHEETAVYATPPPTAAPTLNAVLSDAHPVGTAVKFRDASENNDISLKITGSTHRGKYAPVGHSVEITAPKGSRYLFVNVMITHMGYRGGGSDYDIYAPQAKNFVLVDGKKKYYPITDIPADFLTNIGQLYKGGTWISRNSKLEGSLVYEVPESLIGSHPVVVANIVDLTNRYGDPFYNFGPYDKNPSWSL